MVSRIEKNANRVNKFTQTYFIEFDLKTKIDVSIGVGVGQRECWRALENDTVPNPPAATRNYEEFNKIKLGSYCIPMAKFPLV